MSKGSGGGKDGGKDGGSKSGESRGAEKPDFDLKIKINNLQKEKMCYKSISFKEGNMKMDSKELFGQIVVKDTQLDQDLLAAYDEAKK